MKSNVKHILVIHVSGRIGDTLFITPVLRSIAKYYPKTSITVLAHRNTATLLENCKYVDQVGTISKRRSKYRGWLTNKKYDVVFVSSSPDESSDPFIAYACRVGKSIVTFETESNNSKQCVDQMVQKSFGHNRHIVDYYQDLVSSIGIPATGKRLVFGVTSQELISANLLINTSPLKKCEIIIGVKIASLSSRSYRDWPLENFIEIISKVSQQHKGIGLAFLGGPDEYDSIQSLIDRLSIPSINLSGLSLRESGAIMSFLDLYIGVDTGMSHLMSSYDKPMIILYHPNSPRHQYGPIDHPKFYPLEGSDIKIDANNVISYTSVNSILKMVTEALEEAKV